MNKLSWRRFIAACTVGNVLEWYDFILYGYFSHIFAQLFFPMHNAYFSMMLTYSVFALGCLMRPLGSLFFGCVGDQYGRKKALMMTLILMTSATFLMAFLPTYYQAGIWGPVLLVICRLMQGVAVSGEEVGAAIFLTENAPQNRQGMASSIILSSVFAGLLLGAVAACWVSLSFSAQHLLVFAWRIPFLCSLIFGVVGIYLRLRDFESPCFLEQKQSQRLSVSPAKQVIKHHFKSVIHTISLVAVLAVSIYLFVVYLPTYFTENLHLSLSQSLLISVLSLSGMSLLVLGAGWLADKIGAKAVFAAGCLGFIATAYPIFHLLSLQMFWSVFLAEVFLMLFLACVSAPIFALLAHQFPAAVRFTGVGIGFNAAMTAFGSTAPLVSMTLIQMTGSVISPCWYLFGAAILSFSALPFFAKVEVEGSHDSATVAAGDSSVSLGLT